MPVLRKKKLRKRKDVVIPPSLSSRTSLSSAPPIPLSDKKSEDVSNQTKGQTTFSSIDGDQSRKLAGTPDFQKMADQICKALMANRKLQLDIDQETTVINVEPTPVVIEPPKVIINPTPIKVENIIPTQRIPPPTVPKINIENKIDLGHIIKILYMLLFALVCLIGGVAWLLMTSLDLL